MYLEYYKLRTMPFQLTPDSQFFFDSQEHKRAIAHLIYGLSQEEGFIVITGEIGAGKTMLVERLWSQLDERNFIGVRIATTQISNDDLLKMVADGLGLRAEALDKATLLRRLEKFFGDAHAAGKRCLLVIDEVQNLPLVALEELRMLSNITIAGRAPFQLSCCHASCTKLQTPPVIDCHRFFVRPSLYELPAPTQTTYP